MTTANKNAETIKLYAKLSARIDVLVAECVKAIENEIEQTSAQVKRVETIPEDGTAHNIERRV